MHGAKVARTVIKNWSHVQQRAVRTMSYSVSKSVENVAGNAFEFGLSASKTIAGDEYGGEVNFGFAVASGRQTLLRGSSVSSLKVRMEVVQFLFWKKVSTGVFGSNIDHVKIF